jgi:hypothetical protein
VRGHASSWPFLKPVDRAEVPDYYDHIKFPMGTLKFEVLMDLCRPTTVIFFICRFEDNGRPVKKSVLHPS